MEQSVTLKRATADQLATIRSWYEGAFPAEERRPWDDIMSRIDGGDPFYTLYAVEADGRLAGLMSVWRLPGFGYIEHFAIDPARRGEGIGGMALSTVKSLIDSPVVIEVERPDLAADSATASRRINFYRRHGMTTVDDYDYIQPPYGRNLPEVPMTLMVSQPIDDIATTVHLLHQIVYNQ